MLSFLHEDENNKDLPEGISDAAEQGQEDSQSAEEQEYLMPSTTSKTVKNSTILLTVLLVIGAAVVWAMIKKSVPREASASTGQEDAQIESAIAKLTGIRTEMYGKLDQVADKFYQFSNVNQVSADQLKKNPFIHVSGTSGQLPSIKGSGYKKQPKKKYHLRLWSIMDSQQGKCCMIDDKILYVGDSIDGMVVSQIGKNAVELTSDHQSIVLRMSQ